MRTVIVTGACGGLGRAVTKAFQKAGWSVIGVDQSNRPDDLDFTQFVCADLGADGAVAEIRQQLGHIGQLEALVNNAAVQINRTLIETTDEEWSTVMNTNVRAAFQMIREFHPALAAAQGAVVNISSVHAVATSANVAAYAISKGALTALTRTAAVELASDGIRCNAVLPGAVLTPMLESGLSRRAHPQGPDGNLQALADQTPLGFIADPDQIAPTVIHLADAAQSPYTTGQMIVVDGGATIKLSTE